MRRKRGRLLLAAGALCLLAAVGLTGWNLWEQNRAERSAQAAAEALAVQLTGLPEEPEPEKPEELDPNRPMPVIEAEGQAYIGLLEIPALSRTLPVLADWSEAALETAPCRYRGSLYLGDLIIAGHNYRSHFGSLSWLSPGDAVYFTDGTGTRYSFVVDALETVPGTDFTGMKAGVWDLTLFTCTWGGGSRLAVRCVLDGEAPVDAEGEAVVG